MRAKREVELSKEEFEAQRQYTAVFQIKYKGRARTYTRSIGPYPTRAKAYAALKKFSKELDNAPRVESYTASSSLLFSDDMVFHTNYFYVVKK